MNLVNIIVSDLVPLAERGLYQGLVILTWSLASGIGPPIVSSCGSEESRLSDCFLPGRRLGREGVLEMAFL